MHKQNVKFLEYIHSGEECGFVLELSIEGNHEFFMCVVQGSGCRLLFLVTSCTTFMVTSRFCQSVLVSGVCWHV